MDVVFETELNLMEDTILVQRVEKETTSAGGILLPGQAQAQKNEATVVAVGPGKTKEDGSRWPMYVEPGDEVILQNYAGTEVKDGGYNRLIVNQSSVLAYRR
jgi:chaperonin GroES